MSNYLFLYLSRLQIQLLDSTIQKYQYKNKHIKIFHKYLKNKHKLYHHNDLRENLIRTLTSGEDRKKKKMLKLNTLTFFFEYQTIFELEFKNCNHCVPLFE